MATNSPMRTPGRPQSVQDLVMGATRSISMDSLATVAGNGLTEEISPCNVIDILSAVLLVLQVYEVNPAIVIQTFSQIFGALQPNPHPQEIPVSHQSRPDPDEYHCP